MIILTCLYDYMIVIKPYNSFIPIPYIAGSMAQVHKRKYAGDDSTFGEPTRTPSPFTPTPSVVHLPLPLPF